MEAKPDLEPLLARALAEGRAAWPAVDVPEAAFRRALIAALEAGAGSIAGADLQGVHTADLYLACGCVLALPAATRAFVSQHLGAVPGYLVHLDPSPWLAEEVAQELAEKLLVARPPHLPRIASYGGRGPLHNWVAVAAQRAALSLLRRRDPIAAARPHRDLPILGALSVALDPELGLARAEVKHRFEAAMHLALGALGPRDRMLLRLSLVSGLSCQKIGRVYGVDASTASRWLVRVRDEILTHLRRHLKQVHGLDPEELGSLLGLARSQIELSLSRVLAE
jgi:RNA polymerase sigma-70 factor, ECF subfamily